MIWTINSEMFFADKVILVEGGEFYLLPLIADQLLCEKRALEKRNISIVKVGGKNYFKPYIELLKDLNINYYVIADFDILETGIEQLKDFISVNMIQKINDIKGIIRSIKDKKNIDYESIRKACIDKNSLDAEKFYSIVEQICLNEKFDRSLKEIWEYIKSRKQIKVNGKYLKKYPNEANIIYQFIDELKNDNIFILKEGELEDYITEYGEGIACEFDLKRQKELKIIKFAEMIENKEESLENLFNINEYKSFLENILNFDIEQMNNDTNMYDKEYIEKLINDKLYIIEDSIKIYVEDINNIDIDIVYEDFNKIELLGWDGEIQINKISSEYIDNETLMYYVNFEIEEIELSLYNEIKEFNLKVGTAVCKLIGQINIETKIQYEEKYGGLVKRCEDISIEHIQTNIIKFIDNNDNCKGCYKHIGVHSNNDNMSCEECAKSLIEE